MKCTLFVQEVVEQPWMKELLVPLVLGSHESILCFAVLRGSEVLIQGQMLPGMGFAWGCVQHTVMQLVTVCWML